MAGGNSDRVVVDPLSNPFFWLLAVLIPTFCCATVQSAPALAPGDGGKRQPGTQATYWLHPYLTNYPRKTLAIIVYILILGLELLEGWWVLQVDWGVLQNLHAGPIAETADWVAATSFLIAEGIWAIFIVLTIIAGMLIIAVQGISIVELVVWMRNAPEEKEKMGK